MGRRDPVIVARGTTEDEQLLAENVPDTDGTVTASRDDELVVGREVARQHVALVADKSGGAAVRKRPEAHRLVPRRGKDIGAILRHSNVRNNVAVAEERAVSVSSGVALEREFPNNDALVTRTGDESVRSVWGDSEGSNPAVVALEGAAKLQSLNTHC